MSVGFIVIVPNILISAIKVGKMKIKSNKSIRYKLTVNQEKAFENLEKIGFKKSKLIHIAIDEFLYKNYRNYINNEIKIPF